MKNLFGIRGVSKVSCTECSIVVLVDYDSFSCAALFIVVILPNQEGKRSEVPHQPIVSCYIKNKVLTYELSLLQN